jgi:glucose/arabinose dehydrogenase
VSLDGEPIRQQAQNLGTRFGKVLRLNDDGTAPSDNPFVNEDGPLDGVYTYGHRNIQGMAIDTETGIIYVNEHGARGGDEINILEPGVNYGWPEVTYSNEYWGPRISPKTTAEGMRDPWTVWTPCIAPCGMVVYRGDEFPELDGSILNGGLVSRQVRIVPIEEDGSPGEQTKIEVDDRVRDVRVGPDGHVYILTDSPQGELRRLVRRGG